MKWVVLEYASNCAKSFITIIFSIPLRCHEFEKEQQREWIAHVGHETCIIIASPGYLHKKHDEELDLSFVAQAAGPQNQCDQNEILHDLQVKINSRMLASSKVWVLYIVLVCISNWRRDGLKILLFRRGAWTGRMKIWSPKLLVSTTG